MEGGGSEKCLKDKHREDSPSGSGGGTARQVCKGYGQTTRHLGGGEGLHDDVAQGGPLVGGGRILQLHLLVGDVEVGEGDEDGGGLRVQPLPAGLRGLRGLRGLQVDDGLQRLADGLGEGELVDAIAVVADRGGDAGGLLCDVASVVGLGGVERCRLGGFLNRLHFGIQGPKIVDGKFREVGHGGGPDCFVVGDDAGGLLLGGDAGDLVEVSDAGGDGDVGGGLGVEGVGPPHGHGVHHLRLVVMHHLGEEAPGGDEVDFTVLIRNTEKGLIVKVEWF